MDAPPARVCHRCGYRAQPDDEDRCPLDGLYLVDEAEHDKAPRDVASVALTVLDALELAHGHGLVHRDLKPDNIMLLEAPPFSGRPARLKVLDFGLAVSTHGSLSRITQTGLVSGTPAYMAPEQASGTTVDPSTDL